MAFLVQALRLASDSLNRQGSFEAVLREADSAETLLKRRGQAGAGPLLGVTLLSQPKVFTLAIVWESAKVNSHFCRRDKRAQNREKSLETPTEMLPIVKLL